MRLRYNETESAELDLLNLNNPDLAYIADILNDEAPSPINGANYTTVEGPGYDMGPWDFWEYRMDWTESRIDWYMGPNVTRSVNSANSSLPSVPMPFYIKHWSNGDANWAQGPPQNDSTASVGWVRLFFNSSLAGSNTLNAACDSPQACSTEDSTLRWTSEFPVEATVRWSSPVVIRSESTVAAVAVCVTSLVVSAALLGHAFLRKLTVKKDSAGSRAFREPSDAGFEMNSLSPANAGQSSSTLLNASSSRLELPSPSFLRHDGRKLSALSTRPLLAGDGPFASTTTLALTPDQTPGQTPGLNEQEDPFRTGSVQSTADGSQLLTTVPSITAPRNPTIPKELQEARVDAIVDEGAVAAANPAAKLPQVRARVDYLAGLVAVCSLLVSLTHFILTFIPSVIEEYLPQHYQSEYWARRTIEPFFFNDIWVGIFFTTSTRFLTAAYLRDGSLKGLAEKVACRCPRLMIPITAVILFEYFLMDLGATKYLEYIPSVTWSTWPSTTLYTNVGYFVNETLQLFYLIPNAAPQLTWNFCTGVLWTIPVQLQNSWLVFLGVVVVREIKTPWKRFSYYAFCILNHWYALSWGTYFWAGLLLTDLDITFHYRKRLTAP
ncbi:hypothetical protein LTR66_008954, partial [Elasticomyces elasticus]